MTSLDMESKKSSLEYAPDGLVSSSASASSEPESSAFVFENSAKFDSKSKSCFKSSLRPEMGGEARNHTIIMNESVSQRYSSMK